MNEPAPNPPPEQTETKTITKKPKGSGTLLAFLAFFLGVLPGILVVLAIFLPGPLTETKNIVILRGASVREITSLLNQEGAINNPVIFRLGARILANDKLHAGEYPFTPGQSIADAVLMLRDESNIIIRRMTVPEGLTSWEIANLLRNEPALSGDLDNIPPDGSLLPETYHYSFGDTRQSLINRMQKARRDLLDELWSKRDASLPIETPEQAMVAAAMIEKETGKKAEERPRVAGVFYNRLRQKMRLQSDPTVIYALTKGQGPLQRDLTRDDLAFASPFNTYTSDGLPPSPICNPGRASLEAALHPESNDYLYFVADGSGGHAFASNLADHNKNVAHWISLSRP